MTRQIFDIIFTVLAVIMTACFMYIVGFVFWSLADCFLAFIKKRISRHPVKGYKGFEKTESGLKCLDMVYEVGKDYTLPDPPNPCEYGFHFCRKLTDVFTYYYPNHYNVFGVVEAFGDVMEYDEKSCTNGIRVVKILTVREIREILVKADRESPWLENFPQIPTKWTGCGALARAKHQFRNRKKISKKR